MKRTFFTVLIILLFSFCLCGCFGSAVLQEPSPGSGQRGSTVNVLVPKASGKLTYHTEQLELDASNINQGYLMLRWLDIANKIKLQMSGPSNTTYTYDLPTDGEWHVYPLTQGSGTYTVNIFENLHDDQYVQVLSQELTVSLSDELLPFLYPNEYVNFTEDTHAVSLAEELAADSDNDLDVISAVFYHVVTNTDYDYEKASDVKTGYLPAVDETLDSGSGICMDYAALMTCMLRSQQIPTRLEVGYIGDVYHAWISAWVEDRGWLYNIIEFDGTTWNMMDPTFASTQSQGSDLDNYINNENSYFIKYSY